MKNGNRVRLCWIVLTIFNTMLIAMNVEYQNSQNAKIGYGNCDFAQNGEIDVIIHHIKNNDIVFDVGANKGDWTLEVNRYHKNTILYSFEPLPSIYTMLSNNVNKCNALVFNYALSDVCGDFDFTYYIGEPPVSSFYDRAILNHLPHNTIQVKTTTLDDFCETHAIHFIDFLKIDTEGNEYRILKGSEKMLNSRLIKKIQFEYGGTYIDSKTTLKDIFNLLKQHGFTVYRISKNLLIRIDEWENSLENFDYSNYLACLY